MIIFDATLPAQNLGPVTDKVKSMIDDRVKAKLKLKQADLSTTGTSVSSIGSSLVPPSPARNMTGQQKLDTLISRCAWLVLSPATHNSDCVIAGKRPRLFGCIVNTHTVCAAWSAARYSVERHVDHDRKTFTL